MSFEGWDEIRTAFHVARLGTVSGAAEALGVHHATVIRHIDALEARLGTKLFQRHARGYTATEAGRDLLMVAQATDEQFTQLAGRLKGRGDSVIGDLVVTSLSDLSPLLAPSIARFQMANPGVTARLVSGDRVFRLEYGEAHVAVRARTTAPDHPDNVVQKLTDLNVGLYASKAYADKYGIPSANDDTKGHWYVSTDRDNPRAPHHVWMARAVPAEQIVFRGSDERTIRYAILEGAGIGFLSCWQARRYPELVVVSPPREEWSSSLWLVTHVDLHRTVKVQAALAHLKAEAKDWSGF